jgi:predicted nucleic acid-binding protein
LRHDKLKVRAIGGGCNGWRRSLAIYGNRAGYVVLIDAHARSLRLTVVTSNAREFRAPPRLKVEDRVA